MVRAVGYYAVGDLVPLYGLYALLFSDHGLSAAQVSSLLAIWSVTGFVLEVPSGAWADTVSRRMLLVLGALVTGAGFALWTFLPGYPSFAAGMFLWGVGGSLLSGTFEAFLYDDLAAQGAQSSYAAVRGWASSLSMVATLVGTVLAAPLYAWGGYLLVGSVSVGVSAFQALVALSLPSVPPATESTGEDADEGAADIRSVPSRRSFLHRYVAMLRSGTQEAVQGVAARRLVLLTSLLAGLFVLDEYFPFVAREHGAATAEVPLLVGLTVVGQALGTALAGRTALWRAAPLAVAVGAAAVLVAVGALDGRWAGFAAVAVGYGLLTNAYIVVEARLQDSITGPARATVTSVAGLLEESFALVVYLGFALGSAWFSISSLVVVLTVPMLVISVLVGRWLPSGRGGSSGAASPGAEPATGRALDLR